MAEDKKRQQEQQQSSEKQKALEAACARLEKLYGKGSIMRLGDQSMHVEVPSIPTGALNLDAAIGVGGVPRGRVVEIYGPEASGKTTLALHIIAEAQKMGGISAIIDAEHALDPQYSKALGVNIDDLLISQPDYGEQALDIAETLVRSSAVDVVVIDSVAALVPRNELEGNIGDSHVGLQARLMSQALRKLTAVISRSKTTVIFINQIREKIGVTFGSPETTTGGRALKFYASLRLEIRRLASIKDNDNRVVGNNCRVKVVKNKLAPPFREVTFDIIYGKGISKSGIILDSAIEEKIISRAGAWFSYGETRLGQGRDNVKEMLENNPDLMAELENKLREKWFGKVEA